MKWFSHDADANQDAKLQNVLLDYGLEGYGLYWYCIELITNKIDKDCVTFELEHDARIIARNTGSSVQKVSEMMNYFVKEGLFESSNGVITCFKLAKRLTQSMTSNPQMRSIIDGFKNHDSIMIKSQNVMQDKIRLDKIRLDKNNNDAFSYFWLNMKLKKAAKPKAELAFNKYAEQAADEMEFAKMLVEDTKERSLLNQFGFDRLNPTTYLNQKRWEDDKPVNESEKYKYVLDSFNEQMKDCNVPQAESMTGQRVNMIKHLFATTDLNKENIGDYFGFMATNKAFDWSRGETGSDPKGMSYFLSEDAYYKARES